MQTYRERTRGLVTHTKLEDFIYCPFLYKQIWRDGVMEDPGETDEQDEEERGKALIIGSAFDVYIQDVRRFSEEFAVVARRTGASGKTELTQADMDLVIRMAKEFHRQPFFNPIGIKQYNVRMQWGPLTLSSTPDEKQPALHIDNKTCATLERFQWWLPKYLAQLAFAQMLDEAKTGIKCAGLLRAVSKEKVPKSEFYYAHPEEIERHRPRLVEWIENLVKCEEAGEFPQSERSKCLKCKAYATCPGAIQRELVVL